MRVGIYPSDVAVSTTAELRTQIRATILAAIADADAHLTTSAEAQDVEDRLKGIAAAGTGCAGSAPEGPELADIDRTLLALDVPNEEWDILYRLRLQAERDLLRRALGGTAVIDPLTVDAAEPAARRRARRGYRHPTRVRASPRSPRYDRHPDPRRSTVGHPTPEPARRRWSGPSSRSWASSRSWP